MSRPAALHSSRRTSWHCLLLAALCALTTTTHAADGAKPEGNKPTGYLDDINVSWKLLLSPPPAANSDAQQRDEAEVLSMQKQFPVTSTRGQQAVGDAEASCFRFADVLGTQFAADKLPITRAFLDKATRSESAAVGITKNYWQRPRPYVVNHQITALADNDAAHRAARSKAVQDSIDTTSYPSGHATFGTVCGIVLAQLVPEKHAELFARAQAYRESRMIVGVHFRTDIEAGRALGTAVGALLQTSPDYQRDAANAARELRQALGLPETPPALPAAVTH